MELVRMGERPDLPENIPGLLKKAIYVIILFFF